MKKTLFLPTMMRSFPAQTNGQHATYDVDLFMGTEGNHGQNHPAACVPVAWLMQIRIPILPVT
jgi:hypothetical protein